jgi:hypothetical protein
VIFVKLLHKTVLAFRLGKPKILRMEHRLSKLLDQLREAIRTRHYSIRTESTYCDWARCFILFHGKRHPRDMAADEITAFLTHLANERNVSASTQNQAKSALLFLYKKVLGIELPWLDEIVQASTSAISQARSRLGADVMPRLAQRVLRPLAPRMPRERGAVDGA